MSKRREYRQKCDEAARKLATPVLEWLRGQYPQIEFNAYYHNSQLRDGPSFTTSRVYQTGPGLVRKIVHKRIAQIGQVNVHCQDLSCSHDERILPYDTLMGLMSGVDILHFWQNELPTRPESVLERFGSWLENIHEATDPRKH